MKGPARFMVELVAIAAVAGAGLTYGNHWRRESEALKSRISELEAQLLGEDDLLLELYRKVEQLEARNLELLEEVQRLEAGVASN